MRKAKRGPYFKDFMGIKHPHKPYFSTKKISVYALTPTYEAGAVEIKRDYALHELCDLLKCQSVEYETFSYDGREYDIWFDKAIFSSYESRPATFLVGQPIKGKCHPLCGAWAITHHDKDGYEIGLTTADIRRLDDFTTENCFSLMVAMAQGFWHNEDF